jgi:hypothetical protein
MNWTDIIRPADSDPKETSSRFSGTKKCISLGHANRWFICDNYIVGNSSN